MINTNTLIIFSKNRAMQLHALLDSINHYSLPAEKVIVYYAAEGEKHQQSYQQLKQEYPHVVMIHQREFMRDIQKLVKIVFTRYLTFMCDDDLMIRSGYFSLSKRSPLQCYSLRMHPGIKNKKHFEYPMSLDGHIFNTWDMQAMIRYAPDSIQNPNHLEAYLQGTYGERFKMEYAHEPSLVGIPINRVSDSSGCAYGQKHYYSENILCQRYLEGDRIDIRRLTFPKLDDVHVEIPLVFHRP